MHMLYHSCEIQRMSSTGQGISKTMQPLATGVPCLAIPMDNQSTIDNGWEWGQGYDVYFDETQDVKKGDKIIVNGATLIVQGVKDYSGFAMVSHKQTMCQRDDN
jgi:hypothetical protein